MKKSNKVILIILGIAIILLAITGGAYLVIRNIDNNNNDTKEVEKEKETKEEEKTPVNITLSESQLKEYLSYVPNNTSDSDSRFSAYVTPTNINSIDSKILLGKTLDYAFSLCSDGHCVVKNDLDMVYEYDTMFNVAVSKSTIDNLMLKRYNLEYITEESLSDPVAYYSPHCFYYTDGYFLADTCMSGYRPTNINIIDAYEATEKELIIYEYAAEVEDTVDGLFIKDYYTNEYIDNTCSSSAEVGGFIQNNKAKFTKYKHTFKKNDTGYYWYSTDVD